MVNLSQVPAHQIMCAWGKKVSFWLSIPPEGCQPFPMAEVCRAGRGVTVPCWNCAEEAEHFLSMSGILMSLTTMWFSPKSQENGVRSR